MDGLLSACAVKSLLAVMVVGTIVVGTALAGGPRADTGVRCYSNAPAWSLSSAFQISARAFFAPGCALLGSAPSTLAILCALCPTKAGYRIARPSLSAPCRRVIEPKYGLIRPMPVHCAGLMMLVDVVRAFGGWMGLPVGEDVGLLAAISEVFVGWHDPAMTWLYRRHHAQTTGTVLRPFWRTLGETAGAQRSARQSADLD